jgi:superfamily I DNA/RNA helicase
MQDLPAGCLRRQEPYGFQGAAGTGKTWIAMKKARRLAASGKKVLFLCYNRQVNSFVQERLQGTDRVRVQTFHSFANGVLVEYLQEKLHEESKAKEYLSLVGEILRISSPDDKGEHAPGDRETAKKIASTIFLPGPGCRGRLLPRDEAYREKLPAEVMNIVNALIPGSGNADFMADRIPLAVSQALEDETFRDIHFTYDAVIVDEGQDFHKEWCLCLENIFQKYRNRIVYIFYDDNQSIFTSRNSLPVTELISKSGLSNHIFRLRDNLRNTSDIHDFAVEKTGLGTTSRSLEISGIKPVEQSFTDAAKALEYMSSLLQSLIENHGIENRRIVILSNRSHENSILHATKKLRPCTIVHSGAGTQKNAIRFRTIHQFKGLEADVVMLLLHRRKEDMDDYHQFGSSCTWDIPGQGICCMWWRWGRLDSARRPHEPLRRTLDSGCRVRAKRVYRGNRGYSTTGELVSGGDCQVNTVTVNFMRLNYFPEFSKVTWDMTSVYGPKERCYFLLSCPMGKTDKIRKAYV